MMAVPLAARWLLTAVADQVPAALCPVMCVALTAMTWRSEPVAAAWFQAALFGCAALWFVLSSLPGPAGRRGSA
jgi:hypothetical protein